MSNARFSILQARAVEDKRISNAQFRTLAALGTFGDKDGWCYPKLKTIADMLGKTKQAVSRDLIGLCDLGYVEIHHQYRPDGSQQSSMFRIIFDLPPHQQHVDTPSTSGVDTPSTLEVDTPSTSEVDALTSQLTPQITPHFNYKVAAKAAHAAADKRHEIFQDIWKTQNGKTMPKKRVQQFFREAIDASSISDWETRLKDCIEIWHWICNRAFEKRGKNYYRGNMDAIMELYPPLELERRMERENLVFSDPEKEKQRLQLLQNGEPAPTEEIEDMEKYSEFIEH